MKSASSDMATSRLQTSSNGQSFSAAAIKAVASDLGGAGSRVGLADDDVGPGPGDDGVAPAAPRLVDGCGARARHGARVRAAREQHTAHRRVTWLGHASSTPHTAA